MYDLLERGKARKGKPRLKNPKQTLSINNLENATPAFDKLFHRRSFGGQTFGR